MNATELYIMTSTGMKPAGVWYCEKCRMTARTQEDAEKCCEPRTCEDCGCEIPRFRFVCKDCDQKRDAAKERVRFDKAKKVPLTEYEDDLVYVGDEIRTLEDLATGEYGHPEYVYAVKRDAIKLYEIEEDWLNDIELEDGMGVADLPGVGEILDKANEMIRAWNAVPNRTYEDDPHTVVLIPADFYEDEENV